MNYSIRILLAALALLLVACHSTAQVSRDITLKVTDEMGRPVFDADAEISFERIGGRVENKGLTGEAGVFRASARQTLATDIFVSKAGHHGIRLVEISRFKIPTGATTLNWVLPRILQPIPLYALRITLLLPVQDQWIGYDLQAADFTPPHGKGLVEDFRLRYQRQFEGYRSEGARLARARELGQINAERRGEQFSEEAFKESAGKWRGTLEVAFPREQEGVIVEADRYWFYGQLRLPHLAPNEGYQPTLQLDGAVGLPDSARDRKRIGYYLRTRVKLDEQGRIVSANYAKIYDEIHFDPRGQVSLWYYFNPTPNDRNLEFDPARNLFPSELTGANIANP